MFDDEKIYQLIEPRLLEVTKKWRIHSTAALEWKPRIKEILGRFENGELGSYPFMSKAEVQQSVCNYLVLAFSSDVAKSHNRIRRQLGNVRPL